ncbi:preprotein translocase subunit SecD [Ethanoligenens harbinense]|uniref:Protein translocase subunit SecD n=1 Tax=Ethanoligenens harbinense (strain DSM 18485 / JCM 12961 / CGMCC 1.5033 / YUAN-3) TaxID=663278 RepID=E6U7Q6_ETHHY|nr:SecD/SecF family protein translocase subunit [Ethanoligenens harbinense]ADU28179.1 protein-export membrane protein, SecD/SecF family [Ethanoligenens harbinense YUAN-3]
MYKRVGRPVIVVVAVIIAIITYLSVSGFSYTFGDNVITVIKGAQDMRFGIDIRGGVDVTFRPPTNYKASNAEMDAATAVLRTRLDSKHITDSEIYTDYRNQRIIVRFPWRSDQTNQDPESAIQELGAMAELSFKASDGTVIMTGKDVKSAAAQYEQSNQTTGQTTSQYVVLLSLKDSGKSKFTDAVKKYYNQTVSIYMDSTAISTPTMNIDPSTLSGELSQATIEGSSSSPFTAASAQALADKINAGALPFKLETDNYQTISPKLGQNALQVMLMAGAVAAVLIVLFMLIYYRLPGLVACIALTGHVAGTLLAISIPQFSLTLPGIAGIILSIGMGVDCNIITAERIKEELRIGKTLDGALDAGFQRSFAAIFDGNVTVVIAGLILYFLGSASVKSFGYTLVVGVVFNFLMGIIASRLMLKSISRFGFARKDVLYNGRAAK